MASIQFETFWHLNIVPLILEIDGELTDLLAEAVAVFSELRYYDPMEDFTVVDSRDEAEGDGTDGIIKVLLGCQCCEGCLANGPSCHSHMISHLRSPSDGMTRHPLRSFQNGPVGVCMASMGNVSSHCSMSVACSNCVSMIWCSKDPGKSALNTLMNACSDIIVISWLSSLPLSAPGGLDWASAAVWVFPGTCSRMKW
jgi:hypothetical protein